MRAHAQPNLMHIQLTVYARDVYATELQFLYVFNWLRARSTAYSHQYAACCTPTEFVVCIKMLASQLDPVQLDNLYLDAGHTPDPVSQTQVQHIY